MVDTVASGVDEVFYPETLAELLSLCVTYRGAFLYAGIPPGKGTLEKVFSRPPRQVISLRGVGEIGKIRETERHLEVGVGVPINRLLLQGPSAVSPLLKKVLLATGSLPLRHLLTFGEAMARRGSLETVLTTMEARLELRRQKERGGRKPLLSRWISIGQRFTKEGTSSLLGGEILTKIRIPNERWHYQYHRTVRRGESVINLCGLARVRDDVLEDCRLVYGFEGRGSRRLRDFETELHGQRLPLLDKERERFRVLLQKMASGWGVRDPDKIILMRMIRRFVQDLGEGTGALTQGLFLDATSF